jgi:1,4-alpha-glucan branching enzyme
MSGPRGLIAPILHAHLPYVRHPEHENFLEERWFFEALTESYLPLLRVFERLEDEGVEYHALLSLSPTLVTMLEDELLATRYVRHLEALLDLADREVHRMRHDSHRHYLATWYRTGLRNTLHWYETRCRRRPAKAFARVASLGHLELMTCAATHGFLPLLRRDPGAVTAQLRVACDHHRRVFGVRPEGVWLPECAWHPELADELRAAGLRYFIVDTHGIENASRRPPAGPYAPIYTPGGLAAFARDPEGSKQVWSAEEGYPGHPIYREFYRDLAWELEAHELGDLLIDGHLRTDSGIKLHRITGSEEKELYDPAAADEQAAIHATDFVCKRLEQTERLAAEMDRPPLAVLPYDAELFGHWWFEGPRFLDVVLRQIHYDHPEIATITPQQYLHAYPTNVTAMPAASSWGAEGSYAFWLNEHTDWVYPRLNDAARRMRRLAEAHAGSEAESLPGRALRQAGRELLLAQASDWTFILRTGTSPEYAAGRIRDHLARFDAMAEMLESGESDESTLAATEHLDAIFPELDPDHFRSGPRASTAAG